MCAVFWLCCPPRIEGWAPVHALRLWSAGLLRTGILGVLAQLACLMVAVGPATLGLAGRRIAPAVATHVLVAGLVASRFGLWTFDLCVTQMLQQWVPAPELGEPPAAPAIRRCRQAVRRVPVLGYAHAVHAFAGSSGDSSIECKQLCLSPPLSCFLMLGGIDLLLWLPVLTPGSCPPQVPSMGCRAVCRACLAPWRMLPAWWSGAQRPSRG